MDMKSCVALHFWGTVWWIHQCVKIQTTSHHCAARALLDQTHRWFATVGTLRLGTHDGDENINVQRRLCGVVCFLLLIERYEEVVMNNEI